MKENSIEEDIKIINNFITYFNKNIQYSYRADLTVLGEEIEAIEHILSDYKRVLKENEELKRKNNAIKKESEAYAENMIRLDNELNLEKEKSKYEWIRQNCLSQELVNKLYIPVQKVKDKIEKLKRLEFNNDLVTQSTANLTTICILQEIIESEE